MTKKGGDRNFFECPISGTNFDDPTVPLDDLATTSVFKPSEISPVITSSNPELATQLLANAFARQGLQNIKIAIDSGLNLQSLYKQQGARFFAKGLESRIAFNLVGMGPAMIIRSKMQDAGFSWPVTSLATTAYETLVGTAMEAYSASKVFGVKDPSRAAFRAVFPYSVRNYLGWIVINGQHDNVGEKMFYGFGAGLLSAVPDTIGNVAMLKGKDFEVAESFRIAVRGMSMRSLLPAAAVRGFAGVASGFILSDQARQFICDGFNSVRSYAKETAEKKPATEVQQTSAKQASDAKEKGEGRS